MPRITLLAAVVLAGCGTAAVSPEPSGTSAPTPSASAVPTATPTATSSPSGPCLPVSGGGTGRARITDMTVAAGGGGDAVTVTFDRAVPQYTLAENANGVVFTSGGGKGGTYTLMGTTGIQLNVFNLDWTVPPGNQFPHGTDLAGGPVLREARQIGDCEGVVNIAFGLSRAVCPTVSVLGAPPRLVVDLPGS